MKFTVQESRRAVVVAFDVEFTRAERDSKRTSQLKLCAKAKLAVAIGPRISRIFTSDLSGTPPVHQLIPGLNTVLLNFQPNATTNRANQCLLVGRMEDAELKGAPLACRAIKRVVAGQTWPHGERPSLVLRGFDSAQADAQFAQIDPNGEFKDYVKPRAYSNDPAEVDRDIRTSALVIMPSTKEGFGLVGLDGIAAGVPVLLSIESGLAEYLLDAVSKSIIANDMAEKCLANVLYQSSDDISDDWVARMSSSLSDRQASFARAQTLRAALKPVMTWGNAARDLLNAIENSL